MSKRLEEIKTNWRMTGFDRTWDNDIKWLIEQAERVQKLEAIIEQDERQAVLEGLYEQNKRYREALKFYADKGEYYARINLDEDKSRYGKVYLDEGQIAREALEE